MKSEFTKLKEVNVDKELIEIISFAEEELKKSTDGILELNRFFQKYNCSLKLQDKITTYFKSLNNDFKLVGNLLVD